MFNASRIYDAARAKGIVFTIGIYVKVIQFGLSLVQSQIQRALIDFKC